MNRNVESLKSFWTAYVHQSRTPDSQVGSHAIQRKNQLITCKQKSRSNRQPQKRSRCCTQLKRPNSASSPWYWSTRYASFSPSATKPRPNYLQSSTGDQQG